MSAPARIFIVPTGANRTLAVELGRPPRTHKFFLGQRRTA